MSSEIKEFDYGAKQKSIAPSMFTSKSKSVLETGNILCFCQFIIVGIVNVELNGTLLYYYAAIYWQVSQA